MTTRAHQAWNLAGVTGAGLALCLLFACSSAPIPYAPQPARIKDPLAAIRTLLSSGRTPGADVEVTDKYAKRVIVYARHVETKTIVFAKVARLELSSFRDYYQVRIFDNQDEELFKYETEDIDDAKQFIDAVGAARQSNTEAPSNEE